MGIPFITKGLYRFYDVLHGGKLNAYYQLIRDANENQTPFKKSDIESYLEEWGFDPDLENNPLMNKEDVVSWREKLDPSEIHLYAYTGGSYGEPLRVPYSKKRAMIRTATFRYSIEAGGYRLGEPFLMIRNNDKPGWKKFLRNETIFTPHDISEPVIGELCEQVRRRGIQFVIGLPTVIYEMALYLHKYPEKKQGISLNAMMSISEPLERVKRELIRDVFECRFTDRYSNEETGLIAQQKEFGGDYIVNRFGVYVEIVDPETLKPVAEGESGKVVVTDITNDLVPVVRYDTGDIAIASQYQHGELYSLKEIVGRETEQIFTADGRPIASLTLSKFIYKPLANTAKVYPFQMAQTQKGEYELRLKANSESIPKGTVEEITGGLKSVLGNNASIRVRLVEDIKPQPSGKRPIFKNEMNGDRL